MLNAVPAYHTLSYCLRLLDVFIIIWPLMLCDEPSKASPNKKSELGTKTRKFKEYPINFPPTEMPLKKARFIYFVATDRSPSQCLTTRPSSKIQRIFLKGLSQTSCVAITDNGIQLMDLSKNPKQGTGGHAFGTLGIASTTN